MIRSVVTRMFRLRHELAWVTVGQGLAFLGGFAGIKLLTNAMGSEGYGRLALGMTIAGLLNMFIYGPIGQVVSRYFSVYRERGTLDAYFVILKRAHVCVGVVLILGAALAGSLVWWWLGIDWALLVVAACLFGIVGGINSSFLALQSAIRQRKIVALHQAADTWARPSLAVVGLWVLGNAAPSALVGFIAGTLLVTLSQASFATRSPQIRGHFVARAAKPDPGSAATKELFAYASSFMTFAGLAAISMYADRWVLQGLYGEQQVGIYTALYQIANAPITLMFGLIGQFMVPIIFERAGTMTQRTQAENSSRLLNRVVTGAAIMLILTVIATYFVSGPVVHALTNAAFSNSAGILWILVAGTGLFNLGQLLVIKGLNFNRPNIYLTPKVVQAASFVLLAYLWANDYGLVGVATALAVSSLLYVVMVALVNSRLTSMAET